MFSSSFLPIILHNLDNRDTGEFSGNLSPLSSFFCYTYVTTDLVLVLWKVDDAIHCINHYPVVNMVCFVSTYPLDRDLFGE